MQNSILLRFLEWYNSQSKKKYSPAKTEERFPDLKGPPAWQFVLYEATTPADWLALQPGDLSVTDDSRRRFEFWQRLCPEFTQDLAAKGVAGDFGIYLPKFTFGPADLPLIRRAFTGSMADKRKELELHKLADLGPSMADRFPAWPKSESRDMIEFHQWSTFSRPDEFLVQEMSAVGSVINILISPNEVFKIEGGELKANESLKLARQKGAKKTILLLTGKSNSDAEMVKSSLPVMNKTLLDSIDEIYMMDGNDVQRLY